MSKVGQLVEETSTNLLVGTVTAAGLGLAVYYMYTEFDKSSFPLLSAEYNPPLYTGALVLKVKNQRRFLGKYSTLDDFIGYTISFNNVGTTDSGSTGSDSQVMNLTKAMNSKKMNVIVTDQSTLDQDNEVFTLVAYPSPSQRKIISGSTSINGVGNINLNISSGNVLLG